MKTLPMTSDGWSRTMYSNVLLCTKWFQRNSCKGVMIALKSPSFKACTFADHQEYASNSTPTLINQKENDSTLFVPSWKYASTPDNLITHPYQTERICFLFPIQHVVDYHQNPHQPSCHRLAKSCTYQKHYDTTLLIPSWNSASSPDTIVTHPLRK